jgi:methyl-accepting chemotaxis protein
MLSKIGIAFKFGLIGFLGCAILGVVLGSSAVWRSQQAARTAAEAQLVAVATARGEALEQYLGSIEQDILTTATNPNTLAGLTAFDDGYAQFGASAERQLQALYITDNPNPTGEKDALNFARDGSAYSAAHRTYHHWFRELLQSREYYDIFLFDNDGNLVYTVFKELDYATNLNNGQWSGTDLGNAFRSGANLRAGQVAFFDFQPYAPSFDAPASFISTPIFAADGSRQGVIAFQMPISRLNAVMGSVNGLGETGEAYAIGSDGLMRTDARFSAESTILNTNLGSELTRDIYGRRSGIAEFEDHRGQSVISAFTIVGFHGVDWGIIVNQTEAEALAASHALAVQIGVLALIVTMIVGAVGFFTAVRAAKPITSITDATQAIADGNLELEVPYQSMQDEIGALARTVDVFKRSAVEKLEMERRQAEADARAVEDRQRERLEMAEQFENAVGSIVLAVSGSATELSQAAESLSVSSEQTSSQSVTVAAAADQATANVETVATAAEEMSASVQEIGRQAAESSTKATSAETEAAGTVEKVNALSEAAQRIGDVVKLIQDIAEQTNLLALNATIEAARAGEAGKGFAIVAQEVKQLASQTAGATTEISEQINSIQAATGVSATAITSVSATIAELSEISTSIAGAVEEQAAATQEIAGNVQEAAIGTRDVSSNIASVNQAASDSSASAAQVLGSAQELSQQSELLRSEVDTFLAGVRAA